MDDTDGDDDAIFGLDMPDGGDGVEPANDVLYELPLPYAGIDTVLALKFQN